MELNKYMFREYDIIGVWGKDINEEVSYLIGRAFGSKLKRLGKVETIVGYDNRYSSPTIEKNLVVSVILETVKQIESQMLVRNYKGFLDD